MTRDNTFKYLREKHISIPKEQVEKLFNDKEENEEFKRKITNLYK